MNFKHSYIVRFIILISCNCWKAAIFFLIFQPDDTSCLLRLCGLPTALPPSSVRLFLSPCLQHFAFSYLLTYTAPLTTNLFAWLVKSWYIVDVDFIIYQEVNFLTIISKVASATGALLVTLFYLCSSEGYSDCNAPQYAGVRAAQSVGLSQ